MGPEPMAIESGFDRMCAGLVRKVCIEMTWYDKNIEYRSLGKLRSEGALIRRYGCYIHTSIHSSRYGTILATEYTVARTFVRHVPTTP